MKKLIAIAVVVVLVITLGASAALAASRWQAKMEGNGTLSGGSLPTYAVVEADIGWNFKLSADGEEVHGHLNIVEKLTGGGTRHFQLSGAQVDKVVFRCGTDEVRVEGQDDANQTVAAHFRGVNNPYYPKTIWYWVKDSNGSYMTNTAARLPLVGDDFTINCNP